MKSCNVCSKRHHAKGYCYFHYTKSVEGFLLKAYKNMRQRVTGIQNNKAHIYLGLEIIEKHLFLEWSVRNKQFIKLYEEWVRSNYDRTLTPSVDRKNSRLGYTFGNIEWIANWLNCSYGAKSDKRYEE